MVSASTRNYIQRCLLQVVLKRYQISLVWSEESPFQVSEPLQRKPGQLASVFPEEISQTSTSAQCPQTEGSRALDLQLELFITTTINSGETAQAALQIAGQTTQIKGLQVVPWPLLAEIGHGGMIHELLHHELPETQA